MRYVIVGGGIAGTTAAEELRKLQPTSEIVLISEEQHPVYSRVLLPHYVKGKIPRERVFLKKESWYEDQKIEWLRGLRVEAIDSKNGHVALSDGRELPYDKLLLATGGEIHTVTEDRRGVSYLRTLDDADHLVQLLRELPKGAHAGVYGGGFIGCEYLNIFAHFGIPTTAVFRGPHFWPKIFDQETGALVNEHLRRHGVEIMPETQGLELEGEKEVSACVTDHGTFPCHIFGIGVGIKREVEVAKQAGIEIDHGIVANEYLETNFSNIFTAGDVADFYDVVVGRRVHLGNWMNAMAQGRSVAKTMAGKRTEFRLTSSYATNILGLEIIFVGDTHRDSSDEIIVKGSAAAGGVTQLFVREGRLVGATIVGRNADRAPITKCISEQKGIDSLSF
jgi:NAD(P)H-nitrite reductase large subunit